MLQNKTNKNKNTRKKTQTIKKYQRKQVLCNPAYATAAILSDTLETTAKVKRQVVTAQRETLTQAEKNSYHTEDKHRYGAYMLSYTASKLQSDFYFL